MPNLPSTIQCWSKLFVFGLQTYQISRDATWQLFLVPSAFSPCLQWDTVLLLHTDPNLNTDKRKKQERKTPLVCRYRQTPGKLTISSFAVGVLPIKFCFFTLEWNMKVLFYDVVYCCCPQKSNTSINKFYPHCLTIVEAPRWVFPTCPRKPSARVQRIWECLRAKSSLQPSVCITSS